MGEELLRSGSRDDIALTLKYAPDQMGSGGRRTMVEDSSEVQLKTNASG